MPNQKRKVLLVGAGGFARVWATRWLPSFPDRIEVAGLVDINPAVLNATGDTIGLAPERRFLSMEEGFAKTDADFCVIVVQPHVRWQAINLAITAGLPILAEKPIADTWETSLAILKLARETGTRLSIVQNYRYARRIRTLNSLLQSGQLGRVNYLVCRFAADYNLQNVGGAFRHQVPYAMLYEGAVHHFDQFRNLAGANGARIAGRQWNPAWSEFDNPTTALFLIEMTNGVSATFEMNHVARGKQAGWHYESYRAECEDGAVIVENDHVRIEQHLGGDRLQTTDVEQLPGEFDGHTWVIDEFLNWLDGGPPPVTNIEDNIHTAALTFAALDAIQQGAFVDIAAKTAAGLASIAVLATVDVTR